ncbi:MAG: ATP-binding cassette domain-containing protein, partial [Methylococcaceae bacterium]|nr:ATP-binding cassette domain-containing protein [Methylococcaceae bacterium]
LSGGERNRLLLARLFTKPANLIIMDEPTNDLDLETLELLEEKLVDYEGTLLVVSHDRAFLDNVVTSVLVFEGEGVINDYVGGYSDWLAYSQAKAQQLSQVKKSAPVQVAVKPADKPANNKKKKLSYKEQLELQQLPALIEQLEAEHASITEQMGKPDFYRKDAAAIATVTDKLAALDEKLQQTYKRWDELEAAADQSIA